MSYYFDFEKPIEEVDDKIKLLEQNESEEIDTIAEYKKDKIELFEKIYNQLTPWQRVQVARHPNRPHTADYIKNIFQERLLVNLRNSNFRFLWGSSLLGHLSLAMGLIVLGWIVLDMTQDPWMVSQTIFSYGIFLFALNIFSGTITFRICTNL